MAFNPGSRTPSALIFFLPVLLFLSSETFGADTDLKVSTQPIGSSYYRHVAFDFGLDLKKLIRYEKRGFGRAEIINLILLAKITGDKLKNFGNRRLKREATLKQMTEEAGLDYVTMYKVVQVLKKALEDKGDKNLPPPVVLTKEDLKAKSKKDDEEEAMKEIKESQK